MRKGLERLMNNAIRKSTKVTFQGESPLALKPEFTLKIEERKKARDM